MKLVYEPLFSSYVFIQVHESELNQVKHLNNVVNLVYWKGQPAIIQNDQIEEMKEFVRHHQNIQLERTKINLDSLASVIDRPSYELDGNVIMIKNKSIKVKLPSLGYVMVAEMKGKEVIGRSIGVKEEVLNSNFQN